MQKKRKKKRRRIKKTTTTKHIFINIHSRVGVIDSIINQVIFVTSIGTSNTMTSIISPLKLHSLYSPLWLSNTLNHFSWEVFFSNLLLLCQS